MTENMQTDTQLAACVAHPPMNKGMPDIARVHTYFSVCTNTMNLPGLEVWQQRGCGEKGTLVHCWWECRRVQPLWKTVWNFLRKQNGTDF